MAAITAGHRVRGVISIAATVTPAGGKKAGPSSEAPKAFRASSAPAA
jgi:hypothetical protein